MSSLTVCNGGRTGGGGGEGDSERGLPDFALAPTVDGGLEAEDLLFFFSAATTDAPSSTLELDGAAEAWECSLTEGEWGGDESSTTMGER